MAPMLWQLYYGKNVMAPMPNIENMIPYNRETFEFRVFKLTLICNRQCESSLTPQSTNI